MPKIIKSSILENISSILNTNKSKASDSNKPKIRKRHWALGTMVILGGSWITHTTTATISSPDASRIELSSSAQSISSPVQPNSQESQIKLTSLGVNKLSGIEANVGQTLVNTQVINTAVNAPEEVFKTIKHTVKKGESLGIIFRKRSLGFSLPHEISKHDIAKQLVSLSIGKELEFKLDKSDQLRRIAYPVNALEQLVVNIENNQITSAEVEGLPYLTLQKTVSAEIDSSLYVSALESGLSNNLIMEMVRIFGWDVDFVLDIRQGDSFHVIYTEHHLGDKKLSDGNILAAEFTTQGQTYRAIRFEDDEGNASFYTPEGESMLGTFLRSPVEFSRISSRFGKRKHPISKKWKTHKGVDYAASRGTPIRATADGKVTLAGRKGGYGNTVVLRHAGRFSTLYAHMKGFAKGIRAGSRVSQGQIIGYVGSTGYSTGPHLHYEFRVDGVHRNSLTYKTPKASAVKAEYKAKFDEVASNWLQQLNKVQADYQLAKLSGNRTTL